MLLGIGLEIGIEMPLEIGLETGLEIAVEIVLEIGFEMPLYRVGGEVRSFEFFSPPSFPPNLAYFENSLLILRIHERVSTCF